MNKYEQLNQEQKSVNRKKRVVAYCRVSTDKEDQANSFESQQRYFRKYIESNPDWELYEIFSEMKTVYLIQLLKIEYWKKAIFTSQNSLS